MLIDIKSRNAITVIPHRRQFDILNGRLNRSEFNLITTEINRLIDESGAEIATAGWLPGHDWAGTPFLPIYSKAALEDYDLAAKFFGQCVWYTIMNRQETWASGKYEKDGVEIGSRTYFRVVI